MSIVEKNKAVGMIYKIYDDKSGDLIDEAKTDSPFYYLHGLEEGVLPEIVKVLEGKEVGYKLDVIFPPEKAFGERDENEVYEVEVDDPEFLKQVQPGMEIEANEGDYVKIVMVLEKGDDFILVDANHPFAGLSLRFDLEIIDIREATAEELEHGQIQTEKCCENHGAPNCCDPQADA